MVNKYILAYKKKLLRVLSSGKWRTLGQNSKNILENKK